VARQFAENEFMSSRSSSYEDFLNLPRRVFLDSSVLQNVQKYGDVLFENQELGTPASGRKALPRLQLSGTSPLVGSQRAEFQFAISRSSLKEVARKEDSAFLDWARDMLRHWEDALRGLG
jgi:hypothetical protein